MTRGDAAWWHGGVIDERADGPGHQDDGTGDDERRAGRDRRSLIDLTRAERGEPERRRLPGVDRRGPDEERDEAAG